ncbi:hypothetical protein H6785_02430 [Candidatus Nomurabacteria bacterium]|nr:hypothetical protein [Candidatus Nomurabacteria bacterium]
MRVTKINKNHISALMLGVAMCFAFFAISISTVQAEEVESEIEKGTVEGPLKRAELKKRIDELKSILEVRKEQLKEDHEASKLEIKKKKEETKVDLKLDRAEFMASLEGLTDEERRVKMMEFVQNLRQIIEARKAEFQSQLDAKKEESKEMREDAKEERVEFRSDLEGMSREEKIAAIMDRVAAIKKQMEDKMNSDDDDDDMDDTSDEDEDEDDSDDDDDSEV